MPLSLKKAIKILEFLYFHISVIILVLHLAFSLLQNYNTGVSLSLKHWPKCKT